MKNKLLQIKDAWVIAIILALAVFSSCKKYNYLGFTPGSGSPTISSIHTWSKTDTTTHYDTVVTYDASGNATQTLKARTNLPYTFDSATNAGNLGAYYIIYGSNLGSTTTITFNGYTAYFNRALLSDNSIIVQVPSKTPYLGSAANDSLVVTTLHGKAYYKFAILPPAPSPSSYSNYNFYEGSQITLKGVGFATVTSATVAGVNGDSATTSIVSQNDSVLVLKFNASSVTRGNMIFYYIAAGTPSKATGTQELVDIDNAYQIFTDDYKNGWGSWSWDNAGPSNKYVMTGTQSWNAQFSANGWKIDGFRNGGGGATDGVQFSEGYKYLSFWVYGGSADEKVYIEWGNEGFGNGRGNLINQYAVPAGVWTYYKIPISSLLWNTGNTNWAANSAQYLNTVAFFMNSNSVTEQLYFDDVILIK